VIETVSGRARFVGWMAFVVAGFLPAAAGAADRSAQPPRTKELASCKLLFEGQFAQSIEKLTLARERDLLTGDGGLVAPICRPGEPVLLPPGKYRIMEIRLVGGYNTRASDGRETLVLRPDEPCRLAFLAPLTPQITAKRAGRLLVIGCQIHDAFGMQAVPDRGRTPPPQFAVYQGDREIASGSLEYG